MLLPLVALLAAAAPATPAQPSASWPTDIDLSSGPAIDEDYRGQFAECDRTGTFRGHSPYGGRACRGDPNRVRALRRMPDGAVAFTAKLAVDLDGSPFACGDDHGPTDQCPTTIMLPGPDGAATPVDSDRIPYVVIPAAGPDDVRGEFSRLTGVRPGDLGVVVYRGRVIPVIVADTGPYPLLGEGSLALHRALGHELCKQRDAAGVCRAVADEVESIDGDVTTVLFPGSAPRGLTPTTIAATVRREAMRRWEASPLSRTVRRG